MSHTNETLHYHLPQYVGNDIVNPLVDTNGAYSDIDTALYNIAQGASNAVTTANEAKELITETGGVNDKIDALDTRMDAVEAKNVSQDASILSLNNGLATTDSNLATVTSNVGTLDTTVGGHTTAISQLNTKVGNLETTVAGHTSSINQLNTKVGNLETTASGHTTSINTLNTKVGNLETQCGNTPLQTTAQTLSGAINELIPRTTADVTITADGSKTLAQLFTDLADAMDFSKIKKGSYFEQHDTYGGGNSYIRFNIDNVDIAHGFIMGGWFNSGSGAVAVYCAKIAKSTSGSSSSATWCSMSASGNTMGDDSTLVPPSGDTMKIYY